MRPQTVYDTELEVLALVRPFFRACAEDGLSAHNEAVAWTQHEQVRTESPWSPSASRLSRHTRLCNRACVPAICEVCGDFSCGSSTSR